MYRRSLSLKLSDTRVLGLMTLVVVGAALMVTAPYLSRSLFDLTILPSPDPFLLSKLTDLYRGAKMSTFE